MAMSHPFLWNAIKFMLLQENKQTAFWTELDRQLFLHLSTDTMNTQRQGMWMRLNDREWLWYERVFFLSLHRKE